MSKSSKDRILHCVFTFTDGRQCNMPRTNNGLNLCYFHEQKERQRLQSFRAGARVAEYLNTDLQTSCDLNASLAMLFRAGAMNFITPQAINSLTRLGQLMVETHLLAKAEFLSCYETEWADIVQNSPLFNPKKEPAPAQSNTTADKPDPDAAAGESPKSKAASYVPKERVAIPKPAEEQNEKATEEEVGESEKVGEEEEVQQVQPAARAAAASAGATTSTIRPSASGPIPYHPHAENGHVGPVIPEKPPMSAREVRRLLRQVYGLGRRR